MSDTAQLIAELKLRHPLLTWLQKDGLVLRRHSTGRWMACCPFHVEKTPSFHVWESDHHYHCYGCGVHGDLLDYLTHSRGMSKAETIAALLVDSPDLRSGDFKPTPKAAPAPQLIEALKPQRQLAWQTACEALATDQREIQRLADWRGFSPDTIIGAAQARLMARWQYFGESREAFLVQAPTHALTGHETGGTDLVPISIHCRLAPNSQGNPHSKPSWRFDPTGTRAWPFFWGNPVGAKWIFFTEGQWDAMAIADICGWHWPTSMPPGVCIIGLRGAQSWRLMLDPTIGIPIDPAACAIAIGDADTAGTKWYEEDGFLDILSPRLSRLVTLLPTAPGCKDLNDLIKAGHLTGTDFLAQIRPRLTTPTRPDTPPLAFLKWCRIAALTSGTIGMTARLILMDPSHPKGRRSPGYWRTYWRTLNLADQIHADHLHLMEQWQQGLPPPTT